MRRNSKLLRTFVTEYNKHLSGGSLGDEWETRVFRSLVINHLHRVHRDKLDKIRSLIQLRATDSKEEMHVLFKRAVMWWCGRGGRC